MLHEIRSVYLKKIVYFVLSEKSLVTWMMKRGVYRVLPNKIYYSGAQNIFICMLNTCFSFWPTLLVWKAYQLPIFFSSNYNITTSKNFNLKNLSTFAKTIEKFFFCGQRSKKKIWHKPLCSKHRTQIRTSSSSASEEPNFSALMIGVLILTSLGMCVYIYN